MANIGIIGLGSMGLYHANNILKCKNANIVAVSDINKNGYETLINKGLKNINFFTDPFMLIEDISVDAVLIASPDSSHYELLKGCLANKKLVFCEKPIALDSKKALDIVNQEIQLNKKYIALGFNRRFDKNFLQIKHVLDNMHLGDSLLYKGLHRNDKAFYEANSAFILNNSAGHDVDISSFLLNSRPKEISVVGIKSNHLLNEDCADLLLLNIIMQNNKMANIEVFVNARYGYEVMAQVVCQQGVVDYSNNNNISIKTNNKYSEGLTSDYRKYFEQSYIDEMENWIAYLNHDCELQMASAFDGYSALKTTEVAAKALVSHKFEQVELINTPGLYKFN
jgi:myo-inositol 2-dehydrogenase/D-chiro-inositol 1-dehydrogenase